jgi:large subunit ribosomal protein L22
MAYDYSIELKAGEEKKSAFAQFHDVDASYKDLSQVCRAIKGKPVKKAEKILEEAISKKKAIPFKKFNKGMGHRSELGGKKGKYPITEARLALALLKNAEANALQKGLSEDKLFVRHAAAFKQNTFKRYRKFWVGGNTIGYGKRAVWSDYVTCRAELVLSEAEKSFEEKEKAKKEGKAKKQAKPGVSQKT